MRSLLMPSLRAQRSNTESGVLNPGLLRCARNDGIYASMASMANATNTTNTAIQQYSISVANDGLRSQSRDFPSNFKKIQRKYLTKLKLCFYSVIKWDKITK